MITVGIAAYNAASTLPLLIESLLGQLYPSDQVEIIVADNGSTDGTGTVVQRYTEGGPIRLIHVAHRRGPAVGRNAVVAAASGEIIAFTDADCVAHSRWLAELEAGFACPEVGCVAGAIEAADPGTPTERFYARHQILSQEAALAHSFLPYAQTANAAFRAEVFQRVGLFDENMSTFEDGDLLWRMQLQTGYKLRYRPEALVWHRHRSNPRALLRQTIGWGIGQAKVHKKYGAYRMWDPWPELLSDCRRMAALASLSLRRWVGVKIGRTDAEQLYDAYLMLLMLVGIRLGRWRGSLTCRVLCP